MIELIVAHDKNYGIGKDGDLPWPPLENDMKWVRDFTKDKVLIMGSTTWDSLPLKPLPNRINIVLSSKDKMNSKKQPNSIINPNESIQYILNTLEYVYPTKTICIFGGAKVYDKFSSFVNTFYVTEIDHDFDCDTHLSQNTISNIQKCNNINYLNTFTDNDIMYTIKEYSKKV